MLRLTALEETIRKDPDSGNLQMATKYCLLLLRLANQLLDFENLKAAKKRMEPLRVDLGRFVGICGDYFRAFCVSKNIFFSATLDGGELSNASMPIWFMGELDSLEKVVFNYLANAFKYTPEGGGN
ncbi:MAG: hypothetical protein VYA34_03505 [Myxococcota bacterium]|nr:hypothetical protein [Myxococcota bacterium]